MNMKNFISAMLDDFSEYEYVLQNWAKHILKLHFYLSLIILYLNAISHVF